MKIITINDCKQAKEYDFKGLSTDEKPANCAVNSLFLELDTGIFYYFDGVWKKVGERATLGSSDDTGTIQITENDVYDVTDYDYADVNVPGVVPVGTLPILENGTADVTSSATAEVNVDYATVNFNLSTFKVTNPTALSRARGNLAATTVGNYALFGGGNSIGSRSDIDAYDSDLTRSTPTALSKARSSLAATTIGNYALFGGGTNSNVVDAYDTSLTRSTPTALSQARDSLAATTVGNYALFGGGYRSNVVDAYDQNLTRSTPTELSQARTGLAATTIAPAGGSSPQSGYALFGGGLFGDTYSATVDAYDQNLTRSTPTVLSQARRFLAATTVAPAGGSIPQSGYALFGGGYDGSSYLNVVDAYDSDLTRSTPTALSQARDSLAAKTVGNYALFGGGYVDGYSAVVDAYNTSLTRSTPTELSQARVGLAATSVGNYALFGGGSNGSYLDVVDAYDPYYNIQVFPETKYNFNNSGEIFSDTMQTINIQGPVVGYMKIKNVNVN